MAYKIKGDVEVTRGLGLGQMTTLERDTFTPAFAGYKVWDTDLNTEYTWMGSAWKPVYESDTFLSLIQWDITAAGGTALPVRQVQTDGYVATRLEDTDVAESAYYVLTNQLPLVTDQYTRVKLARQSGATTSFLFRLENATGTADVYINMDSGIATTDTTGTTIASPVVVDTAITDNTIELIIQYGFDATYTRWVMIPSAGPETATTEADLDLTLVGSVDVIALDLNCNYVPSASSATVLDASSGVISLALPEATGTGDIIRWVLDDATNTVSIAPSVGESLNGTVDGTFMFSNYAVGTQFQATDHGNGEWVIAVVGASDQSNLVTGSSATVAISSTSSTTPVNAATITLPKDGKYVIEVQTGWRTSTAGSSHYFQIGDDAGTELDNSLLNGNGLVANQRQTLSISAEYDGTSGEDVHFQMYVSGSNTITLDNTRISYRQLPSSESVLAGMVTPERLHVAGGSFVSGAGAITAPNTGLGYGLYDLGDSDWSFYDPEGMVNTTTDTITVQQDGLYRISFMVSMRPDSGNTSNYEYITVDGVNITSAYFTDDVGPAYDSGNGMQWVGNLTAGQEIQFRTTALLGPNNRHSPSFTVQQLPTSTVVMPAASEVEVDDQTASGYFDIGDMRMQWGKIDPSAGSGNANTIVFPAAFANTNYSFTATALAGATDQSRNVTVRNSPSATSIDVEVYNPTNHGPTTAGFTWIAIGLKP